MDKLRSSVIRLAHSRPDLRAHLLPILAGSGIRVKIMEIQTQSTHHRAFVTAMVSLPKGDVLSLLDREGIDIEAKGHHTYNLNKVLSMLRVPQVLVKVRY